MHIMQHYHALDIHVLTVTEKRRCGSTVLVSAGAEKPAFGVLLC